MLQQTKTHTCEQNLNLGKREREREALNLFVYLITIDNLLPDILVREYGLAFPISYHMLNKSILGDSMK